MYHNRSDDAVIRDVMMEVCDMCISILYTDAYPLCVSYVVPLRIVYLYLYRQQ
jgi:hypothetical protein